MTKTSRVAKRDPRAVIIIFLLVAGVGSCSSSKVAVPNVVGKSAADANTSLAEKNLKGSVVETKVTKTVSAGQVASQSPYPGEMVAKDSTVELIVEAEEPAAKRPPAIKIPKGSSPTDTPRPPPIKIGK